MSDSVKGKSPHLVPSFLPPQDSSGHSQSCPFQGLQMGSDSALLIRTLVNGSFALSVPCPVTSGAIEMEADVTCCAPFLEEEALCEDIPKHET